MTETDTKHIKAQQCPICGTNIDCLTGSLNTKKAHTPTPGSIVVCIKCAGIQITKEDLSLRAATRSEQRRLRIQHPDVWEVVLKAQAGVREVRKRN